MSKLRLAVALGKFADRARPFKRPPIPKWIIRIDLGQTKTSRYWLKIYWATPPWINDEQLTEMKVIHDSCPEDKHVDHIIPLCSNIVCGLHVPWNLQHLTIKDNYRKSNIEWPDHPFENLDLFA